MSYLEENQSLVRIPLAQPQHRVRVWVALKLVNYYIGLVRMRFRVSRMRSAVGKYRILFSLYDVTVLCRLGSGSLTISYHRSPLFIVRDCLVPGICT
jgi:hypothetical protein